MGVNLYNLFARFQVKIELELENKVGMLFETPWLSPGPCGYEYFDQHRIATVALYSGRELCKAIMKMPLRGGMYAQDGETFDVINVPVKATVELNMTLVSGNEMRTGLSIDITEYPQLDSPEKIGNACNGMLRKITDSVCGGDYFRGDRDTDQDDG